MEKGRIIYLLQMHRADQLSKADEMELSRIIGSREHEELLMHVMQEELMARGADEAYDPAEWRFLMERVLQVDQSIGVTKDLRPAATGFPENPYFETKDLTAPAHRVHFLRRGWFKYAAAIVILFGAGAYFWINNQKTDQTLASGNKQLQTDIPPGGDKAVLTLADGSKIILDSAANGNLADQGGVQVVKLANGQIAYDLRRLSSKDVMWNTMSTPKGGQYQVTLPDGTKVWLNAASSITFPTAFTGKERKVKIDGEVYFEVAQNKQQPFLVDIHGESLIQVLGTSFNVNSYQNENVIRTTLVDGSVKVVAGDKQIILKPGYQAVAASSNRQLRNTAGVEGEIQTQLVDIDQTLAWKNGIFNFNGLDIRAVMAQLARWYDIDVRYEGSIPSNIFRGELYRDVKLSAVLETLRDMGIKYRMEGKTLIVM